MYSITRAEETHRNRSCKVGASSRIFIVIEYEYEVLISHISYLILGLVLIPHAPDPTSIIPHTYAYTPTPSITNTQPNRSPRFPLPLTKPNSPREHATFLTPPH